MTEKETIYILGAGAIGLSLAVYLNERGRKAIAVRTSDDSISAETVEVTLKGESDVEIKAHINTVSLSNLERLHGIIVITAKSFANEFIASRFKDKGIDSPIVIMQNGIGVEDPYADLEFSDIYRCVLYSTSMRVENNYFRFRSIASSPIGTIKGSDSNLTRVVEQLDTPEFRLHRHADIQVEIWKKTIINSVFNSICPLLEIDNGIFHRDEKAAQLADEIVSECVVLSKRLGLDLDENMIMDGILAVSKMSDGQLISTLQDIKGGKETEITSINLAIGRIAEKMTPRIDVSKTRLLGDMVYLKSQLRKQTTLQSATKPRIPNEEHVSRTDHESPES
jgi:2-dehydropantoate 2-reductase